MGAVTINKPKAGKALIMFCPPADLPGLEAKPGAEIGDCYLCNCDIVIGPAQRAKALELSEKQSDYPISFVCFICAISTGIVKPHNNDFHIASEEGHKYGQD